MFPARSSIEQADPPHSPRETLPTMYDLPSEDSEEPGLPDEYHLWQAELCSATFCPPNYPTNQVFVASDLNLYYDPQHTGWYKHPDWFAVVGVSRLYEGHDLRLNYVIWQEGVRPIVAMEFLSPGTRNEDLGQSERKTQQPTKWEVYEQVLGIPYYVHQYQWLSISDGEFVVVSSGNGAARAADIIYNSSNGNLYYNPNGSAGGFGSGGQFVTLPDDRVLTACDFIIQG